MIGAERMKHKISFLILIIILSIISIFSLDIFAQNDKVLKIGILSFEDKNETLKKWKPLERYLNESLPEYRFEVIPLFFEEMNQHVSNQKVDFVFTNPSHYIELKNKYELSGAIVTLIEETTYESQYKFGGVIFVRSDSNIDEISDIKGKKISAVSKNSLGGYQAQAYELYKNEIDIESDVEFIFTGMPHSNTISSVLNGECEVGFARTGVIEAMVSSEKLNLKDIKIINPIKFNHFNELLSTELYPEWPFAATSHVSLEISRKVASVLLMLEPESKYTSLMNIYGFNIPANYLVVEDMMRSLKLSPFDKVDPMSIQEIWKSYKFHIIVLSLVIFFLIFTMILKLISEKEIRRKNKELEEIMKKLECANEELNKVSLTDSLTKIYNRRYMDIFLNDTLNIAKRSQVPMAVLVMDIDRFKYINDNYGHLIGDEILKEVAGSINQLILRSTDAVFRFGGDEFVVVLYDTDNDGIFTVAERIHNAVSKINIIDDNTKDKISVTISVGGFVLKPMHNIEMEYILAKADRALYKAKENGRNQIHIITE